MTISLSRRPSHLPWWQRLPRIGRFALRLLFRQHTVLFKPRQRDCGSPKDVGLRYEQLVRPLGKRQEFRMWWLPAQGEAAKGKDELPTLLFFPGSVGNISFQLPTLRYLSQLGCAVLTVDYPGYGPCSGQPSERGCYHAAQEALDHLLEERNVEMDRVLLYGRSLGAAVATYLAARTPCAGLVFHNGFSSLPQLASLTMPRWLVAPFCRYRFDSLGRIDQSQAPLLALHGREDHLTPPELARAVFQRAPVPKRWLTVSGGHFGDEWLHHPAARRHWLQLVHGEAQSAWGEDELDDEQQGSLQTGSALLRKPALRSASAQRAPSQSATEHTASPSRGLGAGS